MIHIYIFLFMQVQLKILEHLPSVRVYQYKYNPFEFNILSTPNRDIATWMTKLAMYSNQYNECVKQKMWNSEKMKELEKNFDDTDTFLSTIDEKAGNSFSVVIRKTLTIRVRVRVSTLFSHTLFSHTLFSHTLFKGIIENMVKYNKLPRPPYSCTKEQMKALVPVENKILEDLKMLPRSNVTDAWRQRCILFYRTVLSSSIFISIFV